MRESNSAVVARNEAWQGACATEPHEAGWASEAILFVRALDVTGEAQGGVARVQISPDGMRWVDEGTSFPLPGGVDEVTFGRVREFGNWLRLAADVPAGAVIRVLVTIALKE